jgi:uncharacterized protein
MVYEDVRNHATVTTPTTTISRSWQFQLCGTKQTLLVAMHGDKAVGVIIQVAHHVPSDSHDAMEPSVVAAMVDAIAEAGDPLGGVNGDGATAASFAGQWTEGSGSAATPFQGNRLSALLELAEAPDVNGTLGKAVPTDRSLMIEGFAARS